MTAAFHMGSQLPSHLVFTLVFTWLEGHVTDPQCWAPVHGPVTTPPLMLQVVGKTWPWLKFARMSSWMKTDRGDSADEVSRKEVWILYLACPLHMLAHQAVLYLLAGRKSIVVRVGQGARDLDKAGCGVVGSWADIPDKASIMQKLITGYSTTGSAWHAQHGVMPGWTHHACNAQVTHGGDLTTAGYALLQGLT